jgi:hypothetical protein
MKIAICYVGCEETGIQSHLTQQTAVKVEQTDVLTKAKRTAMGKTRETKDKLKTQPSENARVLCSAFK